METKNTFSKGDAAFLVIISTGRQYGYNDKGEFVSHAQDGWSPVSEQFRARIRAEAVTITSFGKKQGTAVTVEGNLERRLYATYADSSLPLNHITRLVHTKEDVEALRLAVEKEYNPADAIARDVKNNADWHRDFVLTGKGAPLGLERNARAKAALEKCVALPPVIIWK